MIIDLVQKLRAVDLEYVEGLPVNTESLAHSAADEIERLRAALKAAEKHIDAEEQPYLIQEIKTLLSSK